MPLRPWLPELDVLPVDSTGATSGPDRRGLRDPAPQSRRRHFGLTRPLYVRGATYGPFWEGRDRGPGADVLPRLPPLNGPHEVDVSGDKRSGESVTCPRIGSPPCQPQPWTWVWSGRRTSDTPDSPTWSDIEDHPNESPESFRTTPILLNNLVTTRHRSWAVVGDDTI